MLERNTTMLNAAPANSVLGPIFLLVLGMLFSAYGIYSARRDNFILLLGCAFLVYGIVALIRNRRTFPWRRVGTG